MSEVGARAFAKLTLSLRVLGARDDGYHELEALAVSLGQPHDRLTVTPSEPPGVTLSLTAEEPDVPADERNLACRAVEALLERTGDRRGVRISLTKRIPAGAGLGGGSADAAAALVATRAALELDADDDLLRDVAASVSSDAPFCVTGGAAWMRGRGERIEILNAPNGVPMLLAVPPFRCATPQVYAAWDELGGPRSTRRVTAPPALAGLVAELVNDLEPAAEYVEPRLTAYRARVEDAAGRPALLAGSGSAYVVPLDDARSLPDVAAEVSERLGEEVVATATVTRGVRLG